MEDRYEIRGKIGQGGLGAVYQGYDRRMNRDVAIKRISTGGGDPEMREESIRQLIKEAGALASLQHPHIVTVYDVGADEDGPYVVMELISGKTLDELIERAPLTWPDFREMAMQTQEALIAAQERNMIHSDLKPSNLMLTWLPSGKFQVKIVDFGLATLAHSQSQDLESIEAVFGSIFFMPPEQFERAPLDARSDMYSIGCVYYQALTGIYPYDGTTGHEVMTSHLQHTVKPIGEVRSGIPVWACDWIMWHINRYPQDRPESAREALSVFLKNDRTSAIGLSSGVAKPAPGPPRPRLATAGTGPHVDGVPPMQTLADARTVHSVQVPVPVKEPAAILHTAPQALAPPEGFKPSVHDSLDVLPEIQPAHIAAGPGHRPRSSTSAVQKLPHVAIPEKKPVKLGRGAKIGIASGVGFMLVILSVVFLKWNRDQRETRVLANTLALAEKPGTTEIKIDGETLRILLQSVIETESNSELHRIGTALTLAQTTDGTDADARIADFATKGPALPPRAREILIGEVLRKRNNPQIMPAMLDFAASSDDPALVVAALQSVRQMAGDGQFGRILNLIESTRHDQIREAAEENIVEILRRTTNPEPLAKQLKTAHESNIKPAIQRTLQRLLAFCDSIKVPSR